MEVALVVEERRSWFVAGGGAGFCILRRRGSRRCWL